MHTPGEPTSGELPGKEPEEARVRDGIDAEIDAGLRRLFRAPAVDALPEPSPVRLVQQSPVKRRSVWLVRLAIAGGLVAATFGLSVFLQNLYELPDSGGEYTNRIPIMVRETLAESYARVVESEFEPYWVCRDDREFASATEKVVGRALRFSTTDGLTADGLSYSQLSDKAGLVLIGKVDGSRAVVFINRTSEAVDVGLLPPDVKLHLMQLGDLTLREISTLPEVALARGLVVDGK